MVNADYVGYWCDALNGDVWYITTGGNVRFVHPNGTTTISVLNVQNAVKYINDGKFVRPVNDTFKAINHLFDGVYKDDNLSVWHVDGRLVQIEDRFSGGKLTPSGYTIHNIIDMINSRKITRVKSSFDGLWRHKNSESVAHWIIKGNTATFVDQQGDHKQQNDHLKLITDQIASGDFITAKKTDGLYVFKHQVTNPVPSLKIVKGKVLRIAGERTLPSTYSYDLALDFIGKGMLVRFVPLAKREKPISQAIMDGCIQANKHSTIGVLNFVQSMQRLADAIGPNVQPKPRNQSQPHGINPISNMPYGTSPEQWDAILKRLWNGCTIMQATSETLLSLGSLRLILSIPSRREEFLTNLVRGFNRQVQLLVTYGGGGKTLDEMVLMNVKSVNVLTDDNFAVTVREALSQVVENVKKPLHPIEVAAYNGYWQAKDARPLLNPIFAVKDKNVFVSNNDGKFRVSVVSYDEAKAYISNGLWIPSRKFTTETTLNAATSSATPSKPTNESVAGGFAAQITNTVAKRGNTYGSPAENHQVTADMLTAWFSRRYGVKVVVTAEDVCLINVIQKTSRLAGKTNDDSLLDIAGYVENVAMIRPDQRNTK